MRGRSNRWRRSGGAWRPTRAPFVLLGGWCPWGPPPAGAVVRSRREGAPRCLLAAAPARLPGPWVNLEGDGGHETVKERRGSVLVGGGRPPGCPPPCFFLLCFSLVPPANPLPCSFHGRRGPPAPRCPHAPSGRTCSSGLPGKGRGGAGGSWGPAGTPAQAGGRAGPPHVHQVFRAAVGPLSLRLQGPPVCNRRRRRRRSWEPCPAAGSCLPARRLLGPGLVVATTLLADSLNDAGR